ncbi:MAG: hypothetical protein AAF821_18240 [Cyanobacteria bacterium P01_D01_bin.156]
MPDIMFFAGEKGGVGKSFTCRAAVQYAIDHTLQPLTVIESDRSNPDVMRIYGKHVDCKLAIFSEGEKFQDTANGIYIAAADQRHHVIVNMPAQVLPAIKQWFEHNELLAIAKDDGVRFIFFFVTDGGYDSLNLLKKSLTYFDGRAHHIILKNYGMTDDFEAFDQDVAVQRLIKKYKAPVMDFPKLIGSVERNRLDAESIPFGEALTLDGFNSISRQRVRKFLREAYSTFDQTPLAMEHASDAA